MATHFFGNDIQVTGFIEILVGTGYIDLNKQEIRNSAFQNNSSELAAPSTGQFFFNTANGKFGYYNGTAWYYPTNNLGDMQKSVYDTNNNGIVDDSDKLGNQLPAYYLNRTNHTGTQLASTISDFIEAAQDAVGGAFTNTTSITFVYDDNSNTIKAQVILVSGGGIEIVAGGVQLTNTGVIAGTYTKVTVDAKGRVTSATNITSGDLPSHNHTYSQITDFHTGVRLNRLNEMAGPNGNISLGTLYKITDSADPVNDRDLTNKQYVDGLVQGIKGKYSVRLASTVSVATLVGYQMMDGITPTDDTRVLLKNQILPKQNGIYLMKSGAWARDSDANTWDELVSAYVFVDEGTANADTGWLCTTNAGGTLGTTSIDWIKFSSAGEILGGVAIEKIANTLNFKYDPQSIEINGSLQAAVKLRSGYGLAADAGLQILVDTTTIGFNGTGQLTLTAAYKRPRVATTITGNGTAKYFDITHNFGTLDVTAEVVEVSTGQTVYVSTTRTSTNVVRVEFKVAPVNAKTYRIIITG